LGLSRSPAKKKQLRILPNKPQWARMVAHIRQTAGWGSKAADLCEGLAYSGMRVGESRKLTWQHVDLHTNMVHVPGYKTGTSPRSRPMLPDFRKLMERMLDGRTPPPTERVFKANEASESLANACKFVGVPHMTHQDLRHLFSTTCIQDGMDIPTVALYLGHADGGALAMKTYTDIGTEHMVQAAAKVSFQP
jgi:integrase